MSDYTDAREEAEERWLDDRIAAWQAHEAGEDEPFYESGRFYHVADNGTAEPS